MKTLLQKLITIEQLRFIIVGALNTVIGTVTMFMAYHCGLGYWISSALNYIVGSIFSFFANKYFTFKSKSNGMKELLRFVINIVLCYFLAYGIAKPIIFKLTVNIVTNIQVKEKISMILGMCIFVVINYCGQKLFVFNKTKKREK